MNIDRHCSKHYFALKLLVFLAVYCITDQHVAEERYNNTVPGMLTM